MQKPEEPPQSSSSVITKGAEGRSKKGNESLLTELLEATLMFLPMRHILVSQRVARRWQKVIQGSKKLQQTIFMRPRETDHAWEVYPDTSGSTRGITAVQLYENEATAENANGTVRMMRVQSSIDPWHILEG